MLRPFAFLAQALFSPTRAYTETQDNRYYSVVLLVLLFLLTVTGQRLVTGYYRNPDARILAAVEVDDRISGLMVGAPPEAREQARQQMLASVMGNESRVISSLSITLAGAGFLITLIEAWFICSILSQFFGGQEKRSGPLIRRPSFSLIITTFTPLALRKLIEGILMSCKDPEFAANALTYSEYREVSRIHFDFFSMIGSLRLPYFFDYILRNLTDPFFLWFLFLLILGGSRVYQVPLKHSIILSLLLMTVLGLQQTLLHTIGIAWEI